MKNETSVINNLEIPNLRGKKKSLEIRHIHRIPKLYFEGEVLPRYGAVKFY